MAKVYLARDLRYDKLVAIKKLNPELSAALGPERFLREIHIVAHLNHPHILPLLDSGEDHESLYYVMPYVAGESLRHRLRRETQLPIGDAIAIARDVARALDYAHRQGIVHRDIKPENILMSEGLAIVADFGIARAVTLAVTDDQLTQAGVSPGTPPYMSPEQVSGDGVVDGRSDIYALGCLLYELLAGQPPFTGPTVQAVLARHLADPVPPLRTVRQTVPVGVEQAVLKALEKVPAHRFATAEEFAAALTARPQRRWFRPWVAAAAGVMVLAGAVYVQSLRPTVVDPGIVAVLPFRFSGDSALGFLREGMLDLLGAKLPGTGGLAPTDPQTVMRGWRRVAGPAALDVPRATALRLAQRLGAGKALLGSIVGTSHRMIISANLVRVPGGQSLGTATVEGPIDSLLTLVDRLTAQLLAREAGLDEPRLADVTSTSLSALRSYLTGQSAYRRGHYQDAVLLFREALAQDSTFALAALGLRYATGWIGSNPETSPAWALRGRLSARDRTMLEGLVGPRYPELSSEREFLAAWEAAVAAAPAEAEAWYELGDALFHAGGVLGEDPLHIRAREAFRRAVQLDSDFTAPIVHLIDLAAQSRDTASLRHLGALYFSRDSAGEIVDYLHWRLATALGDSGTLSLLSARMPAMSGESLRRILATAQLEGIGTTDADSAASSWARSSHSVERWFALLRYHDLALNRGATTAALALTDSLRAVWPRSHAYLRIRVADALYDVGDSAAANRAVVLLTPAISADLADDKIKRAEQYADICSVEQWRLEHGITHSAPRSITVLLGSSSRRDGPETDSYNRWCAIALQASLASATSRAEDAPLRSLDSLLGTGPRPLEIVYPDFFRSFVFGSLLAARLYERSGNAAAALTAVQRRPYIGAGTTYLASSLRTEGRLAMLMGDRGRAVRAYQHYLALRSNPESNVAQEVARVRMDLAALERR